VAADEGVQGGASGGEGVSQHAAGLVVCGGYSQGVVVRDGVWRLDLATLRWGGMPALVPARAGHACCAVRGKLVVLGGVNSAGDLIPSVEMLSSAEAGAFVDLPPLSFGVEGEAAIAVEESDSATGQVLLLGGAVGGAVPTVHLVDLATGVCTPGRPDMLHSRYDFAAAWLPDGRVVCAGGYSGGNLSSAEMWGPPVQGGLDAAWTWRQLPAMSVARDGCRGCVMSDGRFVVLGGVSSGVVTSSCEALAIGDDGEHWEPLLPMHDPRDSFACAAVAGCVIVAGGLNLASAEVYGSLRCGAWSVAAASVRLTSRPVCDGHRASVEGRGEAGGRRRRRGAKQSEQYTEWIRRYEIYCKSFSPLKY
jgi:hypothetical protein